MPNNQRKNRIAPISQDPYRKEVALAESRVLSDETRWEILCARQESPFFFGVRTTGVFCKPSCSARRPLRQNVCFYDRAETALAAGFRPCLRCQPLAVATNHPHREPLQQLCRYIQEHHDEVLSLDHLAQRVQLSPQHFQRVFQEVIGITPKEYTTACRLQKLRHGLRTENSVTEAVFAAGFSSSSRVYEKLDTHLGMTPQQYRQGGAQMEISYATALIPLGLMMVGATDRGLCFLQFGENLGQLLEQLQGEYPKAQLKPAADSPQFAAWINALSTYLTGFQARLEELPLDLRGTAFQYKVWQYLQKIPPGQVQSYREVAEAIGHPKAVRAVGSACAANPVAIVVPCHRVLRSDGSLGGYRWGLERKRALLKAESALAIPVQVNS